MSDVLGVVLPFVSVLLGGAITYAVNVRDRRRGKVEDVFHEAIGAVAAAQATTRIPLLAAWRGASRDDVERLNRELQVEGQREHARAVNAARRALARASAYDEGLRRWLGPDAPDNVIENDADAIMTRLHERIG